MNIVQRMQASTPPFFKKVRNIGLVLTAISSAILGAAGVLPDVVVHVAGYVAVAGAIAGAVSQAAVQREE